MAGGNDRQEGSPKPAAGGDASVAAGGANGDSVFMAKLRVQENDTGKSKHSIDDDEKKEARVSVESNASVSQQQASTADNHDNDHGNSKDNKETHPAGGEGSPLVSQHDHDPTEKNANDDDTTSEGQNFTVNGATASLDQPADHGSSSPRHGDNSDKTVKKDGERGHVAAAPTATGSQNGAPAVDVIDHTEAAKLVPVFGDMAATLKSPKCAVYMDHQREFMNKITTAKQTRDFYNIQFVTIVNDGNQPGHYHDKIEHLREYLGEPVKTEFHNQRPRFYEHKKSIRIVPYKFDDKRVWYWVWNGAQNRSNKEGLEKARRREENTPPNLLPGCMLSDDGTQAGRAGHWRENTLALVQEALRRSGKKSPQELEYIDAPPVHNWSLVFPREALFECLWRCHDCDSAKGQKNKQDAMESRACEKGWKIPAKCKAPFVSNCPTCSANIGNNKGEDKSGSDTKKRKGRPSCDDRASVVLVCDLLDMTRMPAAAKPCGGSNNMTKYAVLGRLHPLPPSAVKFWVEQVELSVTSLASAIYRCRRALATNVYEVRAWATLGKNVLHEMNVDISSSSTLR